MTDRIKEIIQSEIDLRVEIASDLSEMIPIFNIGGVVFDSFDEVRENEVKISKGIEIVAEIYGKKVIVEGEKMSDNRTCIRKTTYIDGVKLVQIEFKEAPVEVTTNE